MKTKLSVPHSSEFPVGSLWRRWDPHVHTPASALNNQFKGNWEAYLQRLEDPSHGVVAVGATDYCSLEGYKTLLKHKEAGRMKNILLLFPNVEFRITPRTKKGHAINVHVLVSPHDDQHVKELEAALSRLRFTYKGKGYGCTTTELVDLGRAIEKDTQDDNAAFKVGVEQFKPDFSLFSKWYQEEHWLPSHSIVAISNGDDGASGLSKDSGFKAVRENLYRFAEVILSGNPQDRDYFLGQGSDAPEIVTENLGALKACIHGSDAHRVESLFCTDLERYCWVKADPTFEGLRQVLLEPRERVSIGKHPPQLPDESKVISSIHFGDASSWFAEEVIELNPGVVAIIGEKGSGKTALLEAIAHASGATDASTLGTHSSFLRKAQSLLGNATASVFRQDGSMTQAELRTVYDEQDDRVRYLSQDFVEQLCSEDFSATKLLSAIEEVVFSHLPDEARLEASSFAELRDTKTAHISDEKRHLTLQVRRLNKEIVELEDQLATRPAKEGRLTAIDKDLHAIVKQLDELKLEGDEKTSKELQQKQALLISKEGELAKVSRLLAELETAEHRYKRFQESTLREFEELQVDLEQLGLSAADIDSLVPAFSDQYPKVFEERRITLKSQVLELTGTAPDEKVDDGSIVSLRASLAKLQATVTSDDRQRERLMSLQQSKAALDKEKERITKGLANLADAVSKTLDAKRDAADDAYTAYFEALDKEESMLRELYSPLFSTLSLGSEAGGGKFEFTVRRNTDAEAWAQRGEMLVDKRKRSVFQDPSTFRSRMQAGLAKAWGGSDADQLRKGLRDLRGETGLAQQVDSVLVSTATRADFYDWVLSPSFVRVDYSLKYGGTELEFLSPGARGIALLVLYLEVDNKDARPLLIDQPEGNLDSSSIYETLVPFIRQARLRRQVVIVTHNPNLVVATDADQVVIAEAKKPDGHSHPTISYRCGSLECSAPFGGVREQVCLLLEGGEEAFKKREEKYSLR